MWQDYVGIAPGVAAAIMGAVSPGMHQGCTRDWFLMTLL
jgi:hypothetical protein